MTYKEAWEYVGGLSKTSKMPGFSYSISAHRCITGSRLRDIAGSVCSHCYALKGFYPMSNVQTALERRFQTLQRSRWVEAFEVLLKDEVDFRWHDSGDILSEDHLERIAEVARRTPATHHWLPTREYKIVDNWAKAHAKPLNLNIRLSAHMIDGPLPEALAVKHGLTVSGVHSKGQLPPGVMQCNAPAQGHKCLDCRACWDPKVFVVSYARH